MANLTLPKEQITLRKILSNSIVSYVLAVVMALIASGIFIALMGYDVLKAYQTIFITTFRTPNGFIQTLLKYIPLTLLALAFTVPLTTGKFNIGGEGQMLVGAIAATTVGILLADLPRILLLPIVLLTGFLAGGLWGLIPGWLLYRFRINEILTTVLLNFVSFALLNYVATEVFPDQAAGHPTTIPIGKGGWLPMLVVNPPLHSGLILMLAVAAVIYFYIRHTTGGFELVATGANPRAASVFGINVRVMFVLGLTLGGALAGLAGGIEVAGVHHNLIEGMQSNFLPLSLIIGLISKGSSLVVPFVAFFIAILEVGASAMQRTMGIPVEVVFIVEALILLFVLMADVVRRK